MLFIETPVFTSLVKELMSDEEYAELQQDMANDPKAGDVIPGTGGLRKLRCPAKGKGTRGGARVIYYFVGADSHIRMLLIYPKGVKDDLTAKEKTQLKKLNAEWK